MKPDEFREGWFMKPDEFRCSSSSAYYSGKNNKRTATAPVNSLNNNTLYQESGESTLKYQFEPLRHLDFWFTDTSNLKLNEYYAIQEHDLSKVIKFVAKYKLADFLIWIHQPVIDIFGSVEKTLSLFKCWDEEEEHLVLTIYSELDDMDELSRLENLLFEQLDNYSEINHVLMHLVIAQR